MLVICLHMYVLDTVDEAPGILARPSVSPLGLHWALVSSLSEIDSVFEAPGIYVRLSVSPLGLYWAWIQENEAPGMQVRQLMSLFGQFRRGQNLIWYIDLLVSMYVCRCLCSVCIGRESQAGRRLIWYINLLVSRHLSRCYCVVCIWSPTAQSFVSVIGPLKVHRPV